MPIVEIVAKAAIDVHASLRVVEVTGAGPRGIGIQGPQGEQGEQGEQGPPGLDAPSYNFTQAVPADIWIINHGLGFRPSVELFTVGGIGFMAQVFHPSVLQTLIYHNVPIAGSAHLV